jgi:iron complex transport system substrate-binding protein
MWGARAQSMSGLMRGSSIMQLAAALVLSGVAAFSQVPQRVVSMNLCTDQLAMMLAGPGQLISVSHLAADPRGSALADEAGSYVLNYGRAEEIYLMRPDLVISSRFSSPTTLDMLARLNIPVAALDPAYSLSDVRARLLQMGALLGREEAALALVADFDARLAALRKTGGERPNAAIYSANGYIAGERTLSGQILEAAGFENAAIEAGFASGGFLPLEVLAMLDLDALILGRRYPGASRSEEILDHPVVQTLRAGHANGAITDRDWVCGTPHVLRAIESLGALRAQIMEP